MRRPPLSTVASWPPPNFVDPETTGPGLVIVNVATLSLALIVLAFRLYARHTLVKITSWDDWLMVAAALNCCGVTVCVALGMSSLPLHASRLTVLPRKIFLSLIIAVHGHEASELYGWKLHVWDLTPTQQMQSRKVSIAAQTIFIFATSFSKLSILAHYLRIAVIGTSFRNCTLALMAFVVATIMAFLPLLWAQCA